MEQAVVDPSVLPDGPFPEWGPHRAVWLAWPWDESEWGEALEGAQCTVVAFAKALCEAGEAVEMLVADDVARRELAEAGVTPTSGIPQPGQLRLHETAYGDAWTRDTGPFFLRRGGQPLALTAAWNGWGGKYMMAGDEQVATTIAGLAGWPTENYPFVLEGGALDFDGAGTVLTTRECVLNTNRNDGWDEAVATREIEKLFGVKRVVWIERGLFFDHTDGHVDNIARFVAPGRAVAMRASPGDPHAERLDAIASELVAALGVENVALMPSPGRVEHPYEAGALLPASYLNFFIARDAVIAPIYGTPNDSAALDALAGLFPGRRVVGIPANDLLTGGGSLHCISKEEPAR
jgi:agmatine deiminase